MGKLRAKIGKMELKFWCFFVKNGPHINSPILVKSGKKKVLEMGELPKNTVFGVFFGSKIGVFQGAPSRNWSEFSIEFGILGPYLMGIFENLGSKMSD